MFNFCSLYSGSSGNSLFVQTDNTKILVDAGESAKKIETALNSIDVNIDDIGNVSAFLFSDMSSAITGEVIHVDSGFSTVCV